MFVLLIYGRMLPKLTENNKRTKRENEHVEEMKALDIFLLKLSAKIRLHPGRNGWKLHDALWKAFEVNSMLQFLCLWKAVKFHNHLRKNETESWFLQPFVLKSCREKLALMPGLVMFCAGLTRLNQRKKPI